MWYVTRATCGPEVHIDLDTSMYPGCDCANECDETSCACIVRYGPNYDNRHRLLKMENNAGYCLPIFECNRNCGCSATCRNRVTQQGITVRLEIIQTSKRGLGVRTLEPIPKQNFIAEYCGEIISYKEAKRRTASRTGKTESNYLLVLKEHISEGNVLRTHIDATDVGNVARFMNHSCQPNMTMFPVRINSPVPRLCLFSSRDIVNGEELTFSYGDASCTSADYGEVEKNLHLNFETLRTKCLCEADQCAGFLPFDDCLYNK
ncbi:histone-lysine N-methyltransferase SETMAR-like [Dendronephthya gigantea]|uniref:histone-lysine N-methyltransferase SETMAR-like n=1 Tax=Dendronephthya gigantea TaxID=151771 RepID=UPI00106D1BB7|nr:histone-lysine N-methyltransferase SETMAR-like [Dendronephthya gigantea]